MIDAEVAILAKTFGVEHSVRVLAFKSFFSSALGMVTILAHAIGIVFVVYVFALCYLLPVLGPLVGVRVFC